MNRKNVVILVAIAAALAAAAHFSSRGRRAKAPAGTGGPVFPSLDLEKVAAVEISKNGAPLRIERAGDSWSVTNSFGYPADFGRLRQAILALADLKIGHRQPGMKIDAAVSTTVSLFDESGAKLAGLALGPVRTPQGQDGQPPFAMMGGGDGRYVARDGSDEALLVKESLEEFSEDPASWLDTQLLSVPAADVERIELTAPDGARTSFSRVSGKIEMEGLADGEEFDSSKSYSLDGALAYLRMEGVADPALGDDETGLADGIASTFTATARNGIAYTARIGNAAPGGTARYARISVDPGTNAVPAELAAKIGLFGRFTYLIPSYNAQNMARSRADFIKAKPAESPAQEEPAQEEPAPEEPAAVETAAPAQEEPAPEEPAEPEAPAEEAPLEKAEE